MTDHEDLMKRCQRGATNLNDANNLLAECYGMLGKLGTENAALAKKIGLQDRLIVANKTISDSFKDERDKAKVDNETMRTALTYIRDTTDDWHIAEKAADALIDSVRKEG